MTYDDATPSAGLGDVIALGLVGAAAAVGTGTLVLLGHPTAASLLFFGATIPLGIAAAVITVKRRSGPPLGARKALRLLLRCVLLTASVAAYLIGLAMLVGSPILVAFDVAGPSVGALSCPVAAAGVLMAWVYGVWRVTRPLVRDWWRRETLPPRPAADEWLREFLRGNAGD